MDGLQPILEKHGFKKAARKIFSSKETEVERRYIIADRSPRYADDPHQLYVGACVHVFLPQAEEVASRLMRKTLDRKFPTIGGDLGLYGPEKRLMEWPVDNRTMAEDLVPVLVRGIEDVAFYFWDAFSSLERIIMLSSERHPWIPKDRTWLYKFAAILLIKRGPESARDFLLANSNKLGEKDCLQALEVLKMGREIPGAE